MLVKYSWKVSFTLRQEEGRFFSSATWPFRRRGIGGGVDYFGDIFRGFDEMRKEMEREFE